MNIVFKKSSRNKKRMNKQTKEIKLVFLRLNRSRISVMLKQSFFGNCLKFVITYIFVKYEL